MLRDVPVLSTITDRVLYEVQLLKDAPVLSAVLFGIGTLIAWLWNRRSVRLANKQVDLFKDRLGVSSPDEAVEKIGRLETRIEEAKKPVFWG